jgi:two-component system, OmpR family, response regulator QseB
MRLLLVEDEPNIARPVIKALQAQGHVVRHAPDLTTARILLAEAEPDLMLLDVRLLESEDGGFILAREARAAGYQGSILFMTARDALEDRIAGLDDGGDDYVVKPFDLPELLARVRALLRRVSEVKTSLIKKGALELDLVHHVVRWEGVSVELSQREFALLELGQLPSHLTSYDSARFSDWCDHRFFTKWSCFAPTATFTRYFRTSGGFRRFVSPRSEGKW